MLEARDIQVFPIRRGRKLEVISFGNIGEEPQRLLGKLDKVALHIGRIKR